MDRVQCEKSVLFCIKLVLKTPSLHVLTLILPSTPYHAITEAKQFTIKIKLYSVLDTGAENMRCHYGSKSSKGDPGARKLRGVGEVMS